MYLQGVSKLPCGIFGSARANPCPSACFGLLGPRCLTRAFQAVWLCIFKGFRSCRLALLVLLRANPCPTCFGLLGPPCLTQAFQAAWSCIFKGFRHCRLALLIPAQKDELQSVHVVFGAGFCRSPLEEVSCRFCVSLVHLWSLKWTPQDTFFWLG